MARKTALSFIKDASEVNESLLMSDVSRLMKRNFDRRARALGLTRAQWMMLCVLRRNPGIKQFEIAEKLDVEPITVGRMIDRLQKDKWIERRPDPKDRRANRIYLTGKVQPLTDQLRDIALQTRRDAMDGLNAAEHATLVTLLTRIKSNLSTHQDGNE